MGHKARRGDQIEPIPDAVSALDLFPPGNETSRMSPARAVSSTPCCELAVRTSLGPITPGAGAARPVCYVGYIR